MTLNRPIKNGICGDGDWENMEKILKWTFAKELDIDLENDTVSVLIADAPHNPSESREQIVRLLFENFKVKSCYVSMQPSLSLFASGRTTGLTVECGDEVTSSVPIFEGYALRHGIERMQTSGSTLSSFIFDKITSKSMKLSRFKDMDIVRALKERYSEVLLDFDDGAISRGAGPDKEYELPDGSIISIPRRSCFECGEALFFPSTILKHTTTGGDSKKTVGAGVTSKDVEDILSNAPRRCGIAEIVSSSLKHCDPTLRRVLCEQIVPSGGTSMIRGFSDRLQRELESISISKTVKLNPDSQRKHGAWIGGSMLASLSTFGDMMITKQEYDDHHGTAVHRKCLS